MPEIAEIEPHPTAVARPVAYGSAIVGAGLLLLALLVDCLELVNALLGILHLGVAACFFWWLRRNKVLFEESKAVLKDN